MEPAVGNTPVSNAPRNAGRVTLRSPGAAAERVSVGNLPPLHLGAVLRPLSPEDDLLEVLS